MTDDDLPLAEEIVDVPQKKRKVTGDTILLSLRVAIEVVSQRHKRSETFGVLVRDELTDTFRTLFPKWPNARRQQLATKWMRSYV